MNYQPGDILGGKYQILSVIGGGSMGMVYKAEHMSIRKPVAIKIMQGDYAQSEEYRERFMREARSAASLEHFNICSVMDFDMTEHGDAYIVMELLSGETLAERITRLGVLEPLSACLIMRQLMSALGCAHAKGIVHRDIKPDNVFLIQHEDRDDFVKLIDFGVAHIEHPESANIKPLTQIGQVYGTPEYLAPEQAQGEVVDYRADLYSAGTIFYEMLVGVTPFLGENYLELLVKQVQEPPPHLPDSIPQSEHLDAIIQCLLQKNPDDRFQAAQEVTPLLDEAIMLLSVDNPGISISSLSSYSGSLVVSLQKMSMQSSNSNEAAEPISAEVASVLPKTRRQKQIFILIVSLSALAMVVVFQLGLGIYNQTKQLAQPEPKELDHIQIAIEKLSQEGKVVRIEDEVRQPEPYNITEKEFRVGADAVLSSEPELVPATEAYLSKKYSVSFSALNNVKEKYWNHPNFVRLYLLNCYELKRANARNEKDRAEFEMLTIETLAHLFAIEPHAALNPAVITIGKELFSSKAKDKATIGDVLVEQQGEYTRTALAWLIIKTPYEGHNYQWFKNMMETFDQLKVSLPQSNKEKRPDSGNGDPSQADNDEKQGDDADVENPSSETPEWLVKAVECWKIRRDECKLLHAALQNMAKMDEFKEDVYPHVILPMQTQVFKERKCKKGSVSCEDCNSLRHWIDERVRTYKAHVENGMYAN
ncbi:MAG: serine/threonine protein kinase [Proteobacteria bacterium]|nr:serine/threonine protein kinase [Pseudomonadota bacterium]